MMPSCPPDHPALRVPVVSNDDDRTAGCTTVCLDCLSRCVIVGEVKRPEQMRSQYRRWVTEFLADRGAAS